MDIGRKLLGRDGSSLCRMKRLFGLTTRNFLLAELTFEASAMFRSLFFDEDQMSVVSSSSDSRQIIPYLDSLEAVLGAYDILRTQETAAVEMIEELLASLVRGEIRADVELTLRETTIMSAEREMFARRLDESKTLFRNIVESEGRSATFLAKRVAVLENLSRRDERVMSWLQRKRREWYAADVSAAVSFREADDFVRMLEAESAKEPFYSTFVPRIAFVTESQIKHVRMALLTKEAGECLGNPSVPEEVRRRLGDATVRMATVREKIEVQDFGLKLFHEIVSVRESVGLALGIMLPS